MPGAGFQRKAKVWKEATLGMRDVPFEKTLKAIVSNISGGLKVLIVTHTCIIQKDGKARQSMVSNLLGELDPNNEAGLEGEMEVIRGAAGLAYAGGAESVRPRFLHAVSVGDLFHFITGRLGNFRVYPGHDTQS